MPTASASAATPPTTANAVVIGLELPGFAKLPVAAQCRHQEQLQRRLSAVLHAFPHKDRIVLDTPTGAAVVLFSTPGVALNIACALCGTRSAENGSISVRAGLAMGPVKALPTPDGSLQIAGEALEVAEHIVTLFASERVVATLAYADALRREVPDLAPSLKAMSKGPDGDPRGQDLISVQITHPKLLAYRRNRSGQSKPLMGWLSMPRVALGALAVLVAAFSVTTLVGSGGAAPEVAVAPQAQMSVAPVVAGQIPVVKIEALAEAPSDSEETVAVDASPELPDPAPAAHAGELPRQARVVKVKRGIQVEPARRTPGTGTPVTEASLETPAVLAQAPTERGKIMLAIAPWGEVLVDGKAVGVSPPLTELELESGSHYLEVRNGASPPLLRRIDIQGNDTLKIRHRFADSR